MSKCSSYCLTSDERKKAVHFKKELGMNKSQTPSSTEESVKGQNLMGKKDNEIQKIQQYKNKGLGFKKAGESRMSPKPLQACFSSKKLTTSSEKVLTNIKHEKAGPKPLGIVSKNSQCYGSPNKNKDRNNFCNEQSSQSLRENNVKISLKKLNASPSKPTIVQSTVRGNQNGKSGEKLDLHKISQQPSSPRLINKNSSTENKPSLSWFPTAKNLSGDNAAISKQTSKQKNFSPNPLPQHQKAELKKRNSIKAKDYEVQKSIVKAMESPRKSPCMIPKQKLVGKFFRAPQIGVGDKNINELNKNNRPSYQSSSPTAKDSHKVKSFQKTDRARNKERSPGPQTSKQKLSKQSFFSSKFINKNQLSNEEKSLSKNLSQPNLQGPLKTKTSKKITLFKLSDGISKPFALILLDKIAEHTNTTIYRCIDPQTSFLCCLKKCKVSEQNIHLLINEHKISCGLLHPNLVKSYCTLYDNSSLYLLMEYMEGGVLRPKEIIKQISKRDHQAMKEQGQPVALMNNPRHTISSLGKSPLAMDVPNLFAKEILMQILEGLRYIHEQNVCHRDIKPDNIFISHHTYKIGDFGSACFPKASEPIGTLDYAAPQILLKIPYSQAIDMWSFGCVAYELDVGRAPFYHEDRNQTMRRIAAVQYDLSQVKDMLLRNLISKLLVLEGEKRLTADEALGHPFFQQTAASPRKSQ